MSNAPFWITSALIICAASTGVVINTILPLFGDWISSGEKVKELLRFVAKTLKEEK